MASSPPVIGCLVKKGLQKGGSRAPQDPPGYALAAKRKNDVISVHFLLSHLFVLLFFPNNLGISRLEVVEFQLSS